MSIVYSTDKKDVPGLPCLLAASALHPSSGSVLFFVNAFFDLPFKTPFMPQENPMGHPWEFHGMCPGRLHERLSGGSWYIWDVPRIFSHPTTTSQMRPWVSLCHQGSWIP